MQSKLSKYLVRAGHVTGPSSIVTRHTALGVLLNHLCGGKVSEGFGAPLIFQQFGTRLHEQFLQRKIITKNLKLLSANDLRSIARMLDVLDSHPAVQEIMKHCSVREKTRKIVFEGVKMQYTPDAHGKKVLMDLKTTSCKKLQDFIDSAFEYGYFRQAHTYGSFLKLSEYYIVGISKKFPHKIFIVHLNAHADKMDYAKNEFEFLHYFYKNYGSFKPKSEVAARSKRTVA